MCIILEAKLGDGPLEQRYSNQNVATFKTNW